MFIKTTPLISILGVLLTFFTCSHATLSSNYGEDSNYGDVKPSASHFRERLEAIGYGQDSNEKGDSNQEVIYFFSIHDYNYDGMLDGHELRLAFQGYEQDTGKEKAHIDLADLETMIDHALAEDDTNNDGMISWEEYLESQSYHHKLNVNQT
ncbi:hypothetical protein BATDEDRAFT_25195 [Batrachochytrium dendrobatidis JAM81]|uniref:EF-hand domain-containing protein n=2 Tax=Batrachochytrium dendrobatidis TaxID=109871 RepID=F4P3U4_BATDJ|nr:uncharacterized protein BATDEDRAFT_25195 [Batrachochytrium dendrobatidis JAM81]EGF80536.1 hypothetical protein BATDEDRAFT_25195 [Batrachochytrium dendrobatidis JAM81]KAJ8326223.1 hypothetical protein O5D80_004992 [Batrachochytrium dendrobatidis]KAK5665995.1 hypothetical protein QVD99_007610 [Batrachochytrium dendrobatidis]OAJ40854.1 hypothetical protein BDEG_24547 [Batrachochytrium dendrobatidis JEL423]|eukprot:XP_006679053.1 hypothetical protein BATDEDRAFT_25195 [Batrachochytrium dendrobatidis JAM81]